jgi:hypothetical protein
MKAFLASLIAVIVIAVAASFVLDSMERPSAELNRTTTGNVRL